MLLPIDFITSANCTQEDEQELAKARSAASTIQDQGSSAEVHAEQPSTLEDAEALLREAVARIASGDHHHQPSLSKAMCLAIARQKEVKEALQRSADCVQQRLKGELCGCAEAEAQINVLLQNASSLLVLLKITAYPACPAELRSAQQAAPPAVKGFGKASGGKTGGSKKRK